MRDKRRKQKEGRAPLSGSLPALSAARRRLFLALALLLPVLLLLGLELVLRAVGVGYPARFFVRAEDGPPRWYAENPTFGWRFFPRRLARAPDPIRITQRKEPGTFRIFVFGESAALGDPEPAYGFSRILRELLEVRCPGLKFEVVNVAMTAISSHVILQIAKDCTAFDGDLWIIYMGHNEVVGPFGAGSVFGIKAPPWPLARLLLAVKSARIGQVFDALLQCSGSRSRQPDDWQGMKMFLDEQVQSDAPALQRVYGSFRKNLADIIALAGRHGVKTLVCSTSCNLRDCPPFASRRGQNLSETQAVEWTNLVQRGIQLESGRQFAQALGPYRQAAKLDDSDAVLAFRLARCYDAIGEPRLALGQFQRARDLDTLRFRADSTINQIVSNVCASGAATVRYFDTETLIQNASAGHIPGSEFFWDHVHFNFEGNYRVARGLAEAVIAELALATKANGPVLTQAECAERLALTEWDQHLVLEQMWGRVQEPPFTQQLDQDQRIHRWSLLRSNLQERLDADGLAKAATVYQRALALRADDWRLHHRYAALLEASGNLAAAEQQWRDVIRLVPDYPDALFKLGEVCAAQSRLSEAAQFYQRVLRVRPESFEAMNGLGLILLSQGQLDEAARLFNQAIQTNRRFAQAHVNLGLVAARAGSSPNAEAHYREALQADPECAAAHVNLGNLLAAQGKHPEAIAHYSQAAKLRPRQATIHLSLGNSLQALGRGSDALAEYREAVRMDPALPEAQFNLGLALAKTGDLGAAAACFREAARLSPADPQAHLNLGVALARQGRLEEAIVEFEAVLRLEPSNEAAKRYLKTAARGRESVGQ